MVSIALGALYKLFNHRIYIETESDEEYITQMTPIYTPENPMKKIVVCLTALLLCFAVFAAEERMPNLVAETEVFEYVPATECYVLFLLEGCEGSMTEALAAFNRKWKAFTETAVKEFPAAKLEAFSVNIGTREFHSYRATENPVIPTVTKIIFCTLPPDEEMAVKLLDAGVKAGLLPFCAASRDGSFGAVYYGVKDAGETLKRFYPIAADKLWREAAKLGNISEREILRSVEFRRYVPNDGSGELRFKEIRFRLPGEFTGSDPKVRVSLFLRGEFATAPPAKKQ